MIAIAKSSPTSSTPSEPDFGWRDRFACMLPAICRHARICFRNLPAEARMDAVQEAVATAFVAYARLVKLGKEELAYATPLAQFAVRRVRTGRTVSVPVNVNDVTSPWCQHRRGIRVESLHEQDGRGGWRDLVVEDRHATPADIAATRIDFDEWLPACPSGRERSPRYWQREKPESVARRFGVTPGRISQLRCKLHRAWAVSKARMSRLRCLPGMLKVRVHPGGRPGRNRATCLLPRFGHWTSRRATKTGSFMIFGENAIGGSVKRSSPVRLWLESWMSCKRGTGRDRNAVDAYHGYAFEVH